MSSVNKVLIIGHVGRDAEVRHAASGSAVCNATIATSRQWKDKTSGERQEETEWHRVVFYDRLAEVAGEYLKKGRQVYVEGRLKTRKWTDKDGVEKFTTEIVATEMQLLGNAQRSTEGDSGGRQDSGARAHQQSRPTGSPAPQRGAAPAPRGAPQSSTRAMAAAGDFDDDIPF